MPLRVYDTRTREKRELSTLEDGKVSMYVCGITPYSPSHLGHARCYLSFDVVHRWLEASGYDVDYVQNFTDIDDKILDISDSEGVEFSVVANRNIDDYLGVMDAMNVLRADHYPRVTETIPEIIGMISDLEEKGHAYVGDDGVYFEIDTAPEKYGQLTGQTLEMVRAGAGGRVGGTGSGKRDHRDFALWKLTKPGEPSWESPWGEGRPGWHIECSAMSLNHFGEQFDIHGGGHDLRFPHHEAEIFQSECCTGTEPVVGFWMHNGFVNIDGEKMSKSLGNFWTIREAFESHAPLALRYALLSVPYRNPIDLTPEFLDEAAMHYDRLLDAYGNSLSSQEESGIDLSGASERFSNAMNDDFNTRSAMIEVQAVVSSAPGSDVAAWLEKNAGEVLGLLPSPEEVAANLAQVESARAEVAERVESLLDERESARQSKDWARADEIRDELTSIGVVVEDGPEGPTWHLG
ncbi:MAG: cysteine--tRNA ligase [Euryarchaeota archaeon]|nr:cysteine--tRNA ligase [Euryarchaeota archaeon]|tara:strand:- start:3233 stop:4621 length:1389 start_codon:yes stop_codon:yes gene_type:complete